MENAKTVSESQVELIQYMMPEHANPANNVHGGTIMKQIDEAAAIVAVRHARKIVVTVSVDKIDFIKPVYVGNLVVAKASMNFVAKSSMEIGVRIEAENLITGKRIHAASAYLTIVALQNRKPIEVPRLICETDEEKRRFEEGRLRREKRLTLLKQKKQD